MSPLLVFTAIAAYFALLMLVSYFTSRKSNTAAFFTANRQSPWYLVAFGMIGASLSGVTFISVPGDVGNINMFYFQLVVGYLLGYFVIATVLMPLYYRLNLVTIYTYLHARFGLYSYKTGAAFFLLSRTIGAAFRLFLVAGVLQIGFFDTFGIPFFITVLITLLLIYAYTYKAGIKTIVWTDTLQTLFMLTAVVVSIIIAKNALGINYLGLISQVSEHSYSQIFDWDWRSPTFFAKQFFAGTFIAIVMTGLDQDMMQKNLTCRNLPDAQKNMFWFSLALIPVNLLFLSLGVLLYVFAESHGFEFIRDASGQLHFMYEQIQYNTDDLFPVLALKEFGILAGITFLLGIIAAAFSSADSALTSLTTSAAIDFFRIDINDESHTNRKNLRKIHLGFAALVFLVILIFHQVNNESVISAVFRVAGYTYGPLLGLFSFGLFTRKQVHDKWVPLVAVLAPVLSYFLSIKAPDWFNGYHIGFELLIFNGLFTFIGLLLLSKPKNISDKPGE